MPSEPYGSTAKVKLSLPEFQLGGDPEVFIKSTKTGKVVPSCNLIGGTKDRGIKFGPTKDGASILEDNVAVEFNFKPAGDYITFTNRLHALLVHGEEYVRQKASCTLYPTTLHEFQATELLDDKANVFGCDPDFEAYSAGSEEKPAPRVVDPATVGRWRFCGGHIHLGFDNREKVPDYAIAQLLDMCIGLTSVKYDKQSVRRGYYGMAGLYRPKPYGIEYRTQSNWWLRPEHQDAAQRMACEAFALMECLYYRVDELGWIYDKMPLQDVRAAINGESDSDCRALQQQFRALSTEKGISLGGTFRFIV